MGSDSSDGPSWYRNRQRKVRIQDAEIEKFLAKLSKTEAQGRELAVLVASDDCVRRTNWRFRGKQGSTDVLSFPDGEGGRLGDILISAARAERQAHEYGHSVEAEVKTLILHGFLHLAGYDHETDAGEMHAAERRLRRKYGLGKGLIERAQP
jgi:probable rRNA maturation factor